EQRHRIERNRAEQPDGLDLVVGRDVDGKAAEGDRLLQVARRAPSALEREILVEPIAAEDPVGGRAVRKRHALDVLLVVEVADPEAQVRAGRMELLRMRREGSEREGSRDNVLHGFVSKCVAAQHRAAGQPRAPPWFTKTTSSGLSYVRMVACPRQR